MLNSGVGLIQFFESIQKSEKKVERKKKLAFIVLELKKGKTLHATLARTDLLPVFDLPVIESGEKSGKLPYVFDILSRNYTQSARAEQAVKAGLPQPFFMFVIALFVPKAPQLFTGQLTMQSYLITNFSVIIAVLLIYYAINRVFMMSYYNIEVARARHKAFLYIPFLRSLTQKMALERFAASMALMLDAGLPILEALSLAGKTSPEQDITMASRRIIAEIKSSRSMVRAFQMESVFSEDLVNGISMGSESGKLPEFLNRTAELLKAEITGRIERVSKALPVMIYWFVVFYTAWTILQIYISNVKALNETINGI